MLKEKKAMTVTVIIFVIGVASMFTAVYITINSDSTAYKQTLEKISLIESAQKQQGDLINSNIGTIANTNVKLNAMLEANGKTVKSCESLDDDIKALHAYCSKLKEQQLELREKLANKRPIIKFDTPITFEVIQKSAQPKGRGTKALIK